MPPEPRISLVIPAHNEERYLPALLDSVATAQHAYPGGDEAIEVIVADNASTDATAALAASRGCRVAPVAKRAIAAARNGGARAARGEIVCFTDADMRLHPGTFAAIDRALADARVVGGATGCTLDRWSPGLAVTYAMMLPMVWLTGMDTGVVYCRRLDFASVGGYDESLLVAEDVDFLWRLRRLGRRGGRRLRRLRAVKTIASTRKFDEFGDWHYLHTMPRVALALARNRRAVGAFAKRYWYEPRR